MRTILLVDDKAENLYLLQTLLQGNGYAVQIAADGKKALALARESPPDLVISDILMPVMDGFTLCREWRHDPALAPIPFVFYTSTYTDVTDEQLALKQGADLFIVKPVEPERLLEVVRSILNEAKPRPEAVKSAAQPEPAYLKEYNEVLVRKLVAKVEELARRNQELDRKEKMKSRFLAVAAHELHTPLACMMGYAELMEQSAGTPIAAGLAKGVDRLVGITRNIIRMSKAEEEALPKMSVTRELNALIEEHLAGVRAFIAHRRQHLTFTPAECPLMVTGDPEELGRAFLNLVLNAIRFTPDEGKITVAIAAEGKTALIRVSDTGIGIPAEEHERIFEKFYQLKPVDTHHSGTIEFLSGGLGLGLSLAKTIVEKHGGVIEVSSREGEGSVFTIRLPTVEAQAAGKVSVRE